MNIISTKPIRLFRPHPPDLTQNTSLSLRHVLLDPRDPCDECLSRRFPAPLSLGSWFSGTQPRGGGSSLSSSPSGAGTGAFLPLRLEPPRLAGPPSSKTSTPGDGGCGWAEAASCSPALPDSLMVFNRLIETRERDEERGVTPEDWRRAEKGSTSLPPPNITQVFEHLVTFKTICSGVSFSFIYLTKTHLDFFF